MGAKLTRLNLNEANDTWHRVLQHAPEDISRYILEIAAANDRRTAASLVLVSKQFREWFEPFLYRAVILDWPEHLELFQYMLQARGEFLRANVQALQLRTGSFSDLQLHLSIPKIRSLFIDINQLSDIHSIEHVPPELTQLAIAGPFVQHSLDPCPIASAITHLAFITDTPRALPDKPEDLPNLTHFACYFSVRGETGFFGMNARILSWALDVVLRCPKLEIVVITVQDESRPRAPSEKEIRSKMLASIADLISDRRVVVFGAAYDDEPAMNMVEKWDLDNEKSVWRVAERKLELQQSL
ncbi:hypothetical protein HGRIS_013540 [Hohenbuehelia grisea]|uniref:F-box domain-containing protein n=1 Tax=Hohenbuehelia grisea TaxID=104357 RepID=A0ABR3IW04_9AGAR